MVKGVGAIIVVGFQAKVIQKLSGRWPVWLEVPSFIEEGVMALFDGARIKINVGYVVIRCSVPKEYTREVVAVKFAAVVAASFHTYT